jgi:hypothetical protein
MCQHGALGMARQGYSYDEILEHYFHGIELVRAYEIATEEPSGEPYGPGGGRSGVGE